MISFENRQYLFMGLRIIAACESAIVTVLKDGGSMSGARLREGEVKFEKVELRVGTLLANTIGAIPA